VRELRNLVESMVVLAPRRPIGPDDVPKEIRYPNTARALLPPPATSGALPAA
jgi:DNA-binding NtrC family response regulator